MAGARLAKKPMGDEMLNKQSNSPFSICKPMSHNRTVIEVRYSVHARQGLHLAMMRMVGEGVFYNVGIGNTQLRIYIESIQVYRKRSCEKFERQLCIYPILHTIYEM